MQIRNVAVAIVGLIVFTTVVAAPIILPDSVFGRVPPRFMNPGFFTLPASFLAGAVIGAMGIRNVAWVSALVSLLGTVAVHVFLDLRGTEIWFIFAIFGLCAALGVVGALAAKLIRMRTLKASN